MDNLPVLVLVRMTPLCSCAQTRLLLGISFPLARVKLTLRKRAFIRVLFAHVHAQPLPQFYIVISCPVVELDEIIQDL